MTESHPVLSEREICLLRPENVIGPIDPIETKFFGFQKNETGEWKASEETRELPPGFGQIVLEILTNAIDHAVESDVTWIKVNIKEETGEISVMNNGEGIPIRFHKQFPDRHLATVIFSEYNCSSNYDDSKKRNKAGRNGKGAKATNTWSKKFMVESQHDGQLFVQVWKDNMSQVTKPRITKAKSKNDYTRVTFIPDYERLNIKNVSEALDYVKSMVWNVCAVTNKSVCVYLNGEKLPIRSLKDYAKSLSGSGDVYYDETDNLQVAVVAPEDGSRGAGYGFINGIPVNTGTHMNFVWNKIIDIVSKKMGKLSKATMASSAIMHGLTLIVNATIDKPKFDAQTKNRLTTHPRQLGLEWEPSKSFASKLNNSAAVELIMARIKTSNLKSIQGKAPTASTRRVVADKYEEAENAGSKNRDPDNPVTLVLTEGDSAKNLADSGMAVVGRANYGIYVLRGKPMNPRKETKKQPLENKEIRDIMRILGIDLSKRSTNTRYDRVVVMADQDVDGSHIVGLVINLFDHLAPWLLRQDKPFIYRFATPLVRCAGPKGVYKEFFTEREFDSWWENCPDKTSWKPKYYKGLGTSKPPDAKRYFTNIQKHLIAIDCRDEQGLLELYFGKETEGRKELFNTAAEDDPLIDYSEDSIDLKTFLQGEVNPYARYENERKLPHAVDGLITVRRKVVDLLLSKYANRPDADLKVHQLTGIVTDERAYPSGDASMNGSIIQLACNSPIVGNNINYLVPEGMFGNRQTNSPASPRYIYTGLQAISLALWPVNDHDVYDRVKIEGKIVEPVCMAPVIPTLLCNGYDGGIGYGYSCGMPSFNPLEVLEWTKKACTAHEGGEPLPPWSGIPWIFGFEGPCISNGSGKWKFVPVMQKVSDHAVHVTDLPICTKNYLDSIRNGLDIKDISYGPGHTDVGVDFTIHFSSPITEKVWQKLHEHKKFYVDTNNINLWVGLTEQSNRPQKFNSIDDFLPIYVNARFNLYKKRLENMRCIARAKIPLLQNKARFIKLLIARPHYVFKRPKDAIVSDLEKDGFDRNPSDDTYNYLLNMPLISATEERLAKLLAEVDELERNLEKLENTSEYEAWQSDLAHFYDAYMKFLEDREKEMAVPESSAPPPKKTKKRKKSDVEFKSTSKKSKSQ